MNDVTPATRVDRDAPTAGAAGTHYDVLIIGAGLSGMGAACHLIQKRPRTTFAILEARSAVGGTWDLFRYPGIRSDSDMSTFAYAFRPWRDTKAIADGPSILRYLADTAKAFGVDRHIRFGQGRPGFVAIGGRAVDARRRGPDGEKLNSPAAFSSSARAITNMRQATCPVWPGMESSPAGSCIRRSGPKTSLRRQAGGRDRQRRDGGDDRAGDGGEGGACRDAATVADLCRRPPGRGGDRQTAGTTASAAAAHAIVRWKNILLQMYLYRLSRRKPAAMRAQIIKLAQAEIGPEHDAAEYFNPRYDPWDQRMCLAPDGDLFAAMRNGKASIVNGEIETFTETGLRLASGREIEADIIVTATGLKVRLMGGVAIEVDGAPVDIADLAGYKGAMFSDIPNLASIFGYTNASWTLKSDLIAEYVCRLLKHMDRRDYAICTPRLGDAAIVDGPTLPLTSGYIERARDLLFKQGARKPWRLNQNYALDVMALRFSAIEDGALEFSGAREAGRRDSVVRRARGAMISKHRASSGGQGFGEE